MQSSLQFDVIVIGAGHAGVEAAWAAARLGRHVGICTLSDGTVAHMPCNPAVGGTAKGHLVREIDALGGLMARAIDATGIQFKLLNRSRGPAVWSPRAQADKRRYGAWVKSALDAEPNIEWIFGKAARILADAGRVTGLELEGGERYTCSALVVTTGTFLNGLIHIGPEQRPSGRAGEPPSRDLAESLKSFGFEWGRLKTGTPPRLHRSSIDFSRFHAEHGDRPPVPFSFQTDAIDRDQICCHVLYTTDRVHDLVRGNIDKSPLFNGQIRGIGPRYCPSLEDKVMRFPHRERHQIFLEPEGLDVDEIYVNGFSMSLPADVQEELVHSLARTRDAVMLSPGYAVEYDFIQPTELDADARDQAAARTLPRGANQRDVGLRGSGGSGTGGRHQCRAQPRRGPLHASPRRGVHRHPGRRSHDPGMPGAVPHVHVPRRAPAAAANRQRRSPADRRARDAGLMYDERWERFLSRRSRFDMNLATVRRATVSLSTGERIPASRALKHPEVRLEQLRASGQVMLQI